VSAILGISAYYHDAAAALVVDGKVIAAAQEERFSLVKNDAALPRRAALACLEIGGLTPDDLDAVVFYENPFAKVERVLVSALRTFPHGLRQFPRAIGAQVGSKLWVKDDLAAMLGVPRARVTHGDHHESHAASAFFASPFEHAAVLTVDGVGEATTTAIWQGEGPGLAKKEELSFPHSLGLFYAALTAYLGFEVGEGEYKVMGLAAFGTPRFRDEFRKLIVLVDDGSFSLDLSYFGFTTDSDIAFSPRLEALLGPRRTPGRTWDIERSAEDRRYADVAATLQWTTEEAMLGLARAARRRTGEDSLCLAGGVALNAVANARVLKESGFARVFVQPAAGDAGGALGAAMVLSAARDGVRPARPDSPFLGCAIDEESIHDLAVGLGFSCAPLEDVAGTVARLVSEDRIVAFARGRFEWGPRALGHRSILASPRDAATKDRINRAIKRREPFRPFAPAVLEARATAFFEEPPNDMTPFMTTVSRVRDEARDTLRAVTHVDGTARLQTVSASSSPELYSILSALESRGEAPIVLNTSLNGPGQPMVASATDALAFFASHGVDALVVGRSLVTRRGDAPE
jgi:carbamoyltransferase